MASSPPLRKVAIFDIDGTIFRSSLLIELVDTLIREGVFPSGARKEYERLHEKWLNREDDYQRYLDAVVETFYRYLKGVYYGDFKDVCKKVVEMQHRRVYRYTRDLIAELRKKNYFLLAVSQSPKTILDLFATKHGFDKVYGRVYELGASDRFTGEVVDLHLIANKANVVKRAVEKEGLTLTGSIGVGDTEGDIAFLEMVEKPICFNPNQKLYRWAKRNNAKVVVERKDVIYQL